MVAALSNTDHLPDQDQNKDQDANFSLSRAGWWMVTLGLLMPVVSVVLVYTIVRPSIPPPPPEVLNDPLLMAGREVYFFRCVNCHGVDGTGDGPTSSNFPERVGDLTDGKWIHGDQPEDVIRVIREGVPDSRMLPWANVLNDSETKAVAAYCYFLSNLPIPEAFRSDEPIVTEDR